MSTAAAVQAVPAQAPPALAPVTFTPSLTPGGATQSPLNYETSEHVKLYLASTKGLEVKFNGKLEHLRTFLVNVERRIEEFNWEPICTIGTRYLFKEHGLITEADLRTAANAYSTGAITRSAQNAQAMYQFLMNSVDQDMIAKLASCPDKYKFGDRCNGPALLKTIISLVQVATAGNATPYFLESVILNLPSKMKGYDSILEFNEFVRSNLQSLENYGRKFDRILPLLFQSYSKVEDEEFNRFIQTLLLAYEHGMHNCVKDGEELMRAAEEQYKLQVLRSAWKVPSKTQAQIIALKAQLDKAKGSNNKKSDSSEEKKDTDKKNSSKKGDRDNAWKLIAPKKGEPHTITRGKWEWHWCPKHASWTQHKPEDCRGVFKKSQDKDKGKEKTEETKPNDKQDTGKKKSSFRSKLADIIFESDEE